MRNTGGNFFILVVAIILPAFVWAADSENFTTQDTVDYGGGFSKSENYQIEDTIGNNDISTVVGQGVITPQPVATTTVTATPTLTSTPTAKVSTTPTPLITAEPMFGILSVGNLNNLLTAFVNSSVVKVIDTTTVTVVTVAAVASSLIPLVMNLPMAAPFSNMIAWVLGLFGHGKGRKPWGRVYDAETGQGIPMVAVQLFDKFYNRLVKTELTDKDGRFGFLVREGQYFLLINKKDYQFPSKKSHSDYHGETITVKENTTITVDVPLDANTDKLVNRLGFLSQFNNVVVAIRLPLLVVGTILSIIFVFYDQRLSDYLVFSLYVLIWIWEIYRTRLTKTFGLILAKSNNARLNLAIIRSFNSITNKLVATQVTDNAGRYRFLVDKGEYKLLVTRSEYEPYKRESVSIGKKQMLIDNIKLEKKNNFKEKNNEVNLEPSLLDLSNNSLRS